MTFRTTFRTKLLLLTIVPLAVAQVVTLFAVMRTVEKDIRTGAEESLQAGTAIVGEYLASHSEQLQTSVGVLAADYGLKEATATNDAATIRSVLENHSRRVGADIAILLDLDGRLIASTLDVDRAEFAAFRNLVADFDRGRSEFAARISGNAYQLFSVPLRAPVRIAWVVLGFKIDLPLAQQIADLTGLDVSIVHGTGDDTNVVSSAVARPVEIDRRQPNDVVYMANSDQTLTIQTPFIRGDDTTLVVLQRSLREAMQPYVEARSGLIAFGAVLVIFVAVAGAWFSTTVAQPLRTLGAAARRMISGNYDTSVDVVSDDEFGELASSFNAMQTAIAEREQRISHNALHDPLTNLPNRTKILKRLTTAIERARTDDAHVAVLSIRLDRMNEIASTLGHNAADDLIRMAARHLEANLGRSEMLGHTGSSEFVLVLPGQDAANAMSYVDRIQRLLGSGVTLGRVNIILQTDIGVAEFPRHGDAPADLLRFASIARTDAASGNERVRIYQPGREEEFLRRLRIVNDLPTALHNGDLETWFQPQVSLPGTAVSGAEALVRWTHPELGQLSPMDFIPAAEQSGTIVALTRHVLGVAARESRAWLDAGHELQVAVNLSARDLLDEYLPYHVMQVLRENRLPASSLTLEVTENSIMEDLNRALSVLELLRDIGVQIAMDDFGTGHSSLAQLRNIPLHELKIDKSFVVDICTDEHNEAIVRTTVELAHAMRLRVVAEGVEDEAALHKITEIGCEQAQGNLISRPLPAAEFRVWVADYKPVTRRERRGDKRAFGGTA